MIKDCSTCIHKEGSCYPSLTIFDKDKTCGSYEPDYEGYIEELEKENKVLRIHQTNAVLNGLEMKVLKDSHRDRANKLQDQLTKAKEILKMIVDYYPCYNKTITEQAEQFLEEIEK